MFQQLPPETVNTGVMERGRIVLSGSGASLLDDPQVQATYLGRHDRAAVAGGPARPGADRPDRGEVHVVEERVGRLEGPGVRAGRRVSAAAGRAVVDLHADRVVVQREHHVSRDCDVDRHRAARTDGDRPRDMAPSPLASLAASPSGRGNSPSRGAR